MMGPTASGATDPAALVCRLHPLVTYGPWDLDISYALAPFGFDEVKWAEGQALVAELLTCDPPPPRLVAQAAGWYNEAAGCAGRALAARPALLSRLGLHEVMCNG